MTELDRSTAAGRAAFEVLLEGARPRLRAVIRRLVGHPEDTADLVQQAMLRAWESADGFRGESSFATWLCAIGTRLAIDHLRAKARWRARAQVVYAAECLDDPALAGELFGVILSPEQRYDVHEHIAACFTCVGRSLAPEEQAALMLRDVEGLDNAAAAKVLGVSTSVLRHRLAAARQAMRERYDDLCSLVRKEGVCHQCAGLRDAHPPDRRGPDVPTEALTADRRAAIVRAADLDGGVSRPMHDQMFRHLEQIEEEGRGDERVTTSCGTS
ncbi:MAG: RNA polymerase sigma factor [Myxococcales bacterium]|nr:RNA polymerase sigma factor [Myxococcales bacterium]